MRSLAILSTTTALLLGGCNLYFGGGNGNPPPVSGDDVMWVPDGGVSDGGEGWGDAWTGGDGGTGGGDAQCNSLNCTENPALAAEMQWAACLSVSAPAFASSKAYLIASLPTDSGTCASCHATGGADEYLSTNQASMLYAWQEEAFITTVFTPAPIPGPPNHPAYGIAVDDTKLCAKGTEKANGTGSHPAYDCNVSVSGVGALQAVHSFHDLVQATLDANECPAPSFSP
jgi:hypothetical protein